METNNHEILIWGIYQVHNFNMHIPVDCNPPLAAAIPKYSATGSHALPPAHGALVSCSGGLLSELVSGERGGLGQWWLALCTT